MSTGIRETHLNVTETLVSEFFVPDSVIEFKNQESTFSQMISISAATMSTSIATPTEAPFDDSLLRFPLYLRICATSICIFLLTIGCPGNILVPYVVFKTKELRNSTNIFLINLSVSDLLILLITSPTILIELHSQPEVWFLGLFMCKSLSVSVSFSFLFVYQAVCHPLLWKEEFCLSAVSVYVSVCVSKVSRSFH